MALDINELLKDANLTDAQREALQSAVANPTVGKRLEEGYLRQSDYSRRLAELQKQVQETQNWKSALDQWAQDNNYGQQSQQHAQEDEYVSKAHLDALKQQLVGIEAGALKLLPLMNLKSLEYFKEFGKILDANAIIEKARTEGTTFEVAYDRFTQPERDSKREKEFEERVARERAEAVKEALANMAIPTGQQNQFSQQGVTHVLDAIAHKAEGQEFGWKAAAAAHQKDALAGTLKRD